MSKLTGRISLAYKKLTDADARIDREQKKHKESIRRLQNRTAREKAESVLKVEIMNRRTAIAEAKAVLRKAQRDSSYEGEAAQKARQAHAKAILGWGNLLGVKPPSAKTKKEIKSKVKSTGKGLKKIGKIGWTVWKNVGKGALTPPKGKKKKP